MPNRKIKDAVPTLQSGVEARWAMPHVPQDVVWGTARQGDGSGACSDPGPQGGPKMP